MEILENMFIKLLLCQTVLILQQKSRGSFVLELLSYFLEKFLHILSQFTEKSDLCMFYSSKDPQIHLHFRARLGRALTFDLGLSI